MLDPWFSLKMHLIYSAALLVLKHTNKAFVKCQSHRLSLWPRLMISKFAGSLHCSFWRKKISVTVTVVAFVAMGQESRLLITILDLETSM